VGHGKDLKKRGGQPDPLDGADRGKDLLIETLAPGRHLKARPARQGVKGPAEPIQGALIGKPDGEIRADPKGDPKDREGRPQGMSQKGPQAKGSKEEEVSSHGTSLYPLIPPPLRQAGIR
jgi:hypothetical protein